MIPQWLTKRVVKFAMKHLLGRILRNELDMEQLDVQIGSGTIHLKDLALNTNYFNDQVRVCSLWMSVVAVVGWPRGPAVFLWRFWCGCAYFFIFFID